MTFWDWAARRLEHTLAAALEHPLPDPQLPPLTATERDTYGISG